MKNNNTKNSRITSSGDDNHNSQTNEQHCFTHRAKAFANKLESSKCWEIKLESLSPIKITSDIRHNKYADIGSCGINPKYSVLLSKPKSHDNFKEVESVTYTMDNRHGSENTVDEAKPKAAKRK